jgi:protein-S-isoprenylcysteine O-methyltransferase Ste14
MPHLALFLCLVWLVLLFGVRTLIQWRRTGSTGWKGFHGAVGSPSWTAGASFAIGVLLAPMAPVAALLHWPGGGLLPTAPLPHVLGAACMLFGLAGALAAQLWMGDSWRIGVDDSEQTKLVTGGLFAWVRNPIFSFVCLSMLGLLLLVPNPLAFLAAALIALGVELQVRVVEEPHLRHMHGSEYERYAARVGRFVPGLGRSPASGTSAEPTGA